MTMPVCVRRSLQSAAHRRTRLQPIPSQPQKGSDLAEFESQALYTANKGQRFYVALGVLPESTRCSRCSREQCNAFAESNRVNAKTDLFRDDANLHGLGLSSLLSPTSPSKLRKEIAQRIGVGFKLPE
jgi:hypothetical protein